MTDVLAVIYSLPFLVGALTGAGLMKLYQFMLVCHANKTHPLPNGEKHHMPGISHFWMGGLLSLAVLGYVLLQVGQTEQHYRALGGEMRRCQVEFTTALERRSVINSENDKLSREQRDLLAELMRAESAWVSRMVILPPDIAGLPSNDQRVEGWRLAVTRIYLDRAGKLNDRVEAISARQAQLEEERAANQLPEPACGR